MRPSITLAANREAVSHNRSCAAQHALRYVNGLSKSEFLADTRTQEAVIHNIFVIGEAATKLVKEHGEFVERHDEVPWRSMRGMRNRIAHGYFDVDLELVRQTSQTALPQLVQKLKIIRDQTP
jgi:uncharacterized protein with HEPN domain